MNTMYYYSLTLSFGSEETCPKIGDTTTNHIEKMSGATVPNFSEIAGINGLVEAFKHAEQPSTDLPEDQLQFLSPGLWAVYVEFNDAESRDSFVNAYEPVVSYLSENSFLVETATGSHSYNDEILLEGTLAHAVQSKGISALMLNTAPEEMSIPVHGNLVERGIITEEFEIGYLDSFVKIPEDNPAQ